MWAFVELSNGSVVCKEVHSSLVRAVRIIHMYDRYRAVQKFHAETGTKAFGKIHPKYAVVHEM